MKNENQTQTYQISQAMMNCFKQLLFSKDGDVSLQGIVDDLTFGNGDDLKACSVAFAFKGIKPEINKATRYEYNWQSYYAYEIINYSMILNSYKVRRKSYAYDKETKQFIDKNDNCDLVMQAGLIECLDTTLDLSKVRGIKE